MSPMMGSGGETITPIIKNGPMSPAVNSGAMSPIVGRSGAMSPMVKSGAMSPGKAGGSVNASGRSRSVLMDAGGGGGNRFPRSLAGHHQWTRYNNARYNKSNVF